MTAPDATAPGRLEVTAADAAPADWEELLQAAPAADYPHTRHWHESVCRNRRGARQAWWTARRDGRLLGGLGGVVSPGIRLAGGLLRSRRLDSSVEGTSGGPLVRPDLAPQLQAEIFTSLLRAFQAARPPGLGSAAIALNPLSESAFGHLLTPQDGWVRRDSPTAMVSLAGGIDEVASSRLVMNKRNERNRGLKRGAVITVTRDPALLAAYYPIYAAATAHWGVAPTPLPLLQDLLADPDDRVFFTCVQLDGQVIGGHLCLHLGARVFAWNGVTDPAFAKTHFPATLCFWGDLQEACRRGAAWLDFGASGGIQSLSGFKRYFGAELMTRGFYVNDTGGLKALRRLGGLRARLGRGAASRWHDGPGGGESGAA